jgi:DNA helicase II / ATP-dependent DNA helicase PcrA
MKKFILKRESGSAKKPNYQIEYEKLLNESQQIAVFHEHGPALVIAGAGTGKTRTLVYRVARLVEAGVDPSEILLLTFTRKASNEMINRAIRILDDRCTQVKGGTFHYYCSQILHRFADRIGYPDNFTIIDASDSMDTIQLIRSQMQLTDRNSRFPKKSTLYNIYSSSINKQQSLAETLEDQYPQFLHHLEDISSLFTKFQNYKELNRVMDFDDLLVRTCQLLNDYDDVREAVAGRHRHVMVDEYQDTNALQAELTKLFSSVHKNVMAVGDDAQSIYSFRGADHKNIMAFPDLFIDVKIIKLEENYRSTQRILELANSVLSQAKEKFDKTLYTKNEKGELPGLVKAANHNDQSRFLTQMILQLREQGYELNDISVLFRNGRDSFDLEVELNKKNIPYVKFGGQKFTEAAHVKDVIAHIRVLINPLDTISWNRLLMLIDGIGPKTAQDLFQWIRNSDTPFQINQASSVSERYAIQLKALADLFSQMQKKKDSVPEVLETVVRYYESFCKKRYDDHPKRLKDLETFIDISGSYRSLENLLEDITLDPIEATAYDTEASKKDEAPLILSTIHSAKGLEWRIVFIIQCLDGIIPSGYAIDDPDQIDEELRLLYVACTRAKEQLYFTYPALYQGGYGDYFTNPSRFLEELSDNLFEPWILIEEHAAENKTQLESGKNELNSAD